MLFAERDAYGVEQCESLTSEMMIQNDVTRQCFQADSNLFRQRPTVKRMLSHPSATEMAIRLCTMVGSLRDPGTSPCITLASGFDQLNTIDIDSNHRGNSKVDRCSKILTYILFIIGSSQWLAQGSSS